jgi:hypothetical protein
VNLRLRIRLLVVWGFYQVVRLSPAGTGLGQGPLEVRGVGGRTETRLKGYFLTLFCAKILAAAVAEPSR